MPEIMENVTSAPRIAFILIDILALVVLVLAATGIYGVSSYNVGQRTQEVGVRLTFGAPPNAILYMLVRPATTLTLLGVAAGLLCALLMTRLMYSPLYGVSSSTDPVIVNWRTLADAFIHERIGAGMSAFRRDLTGAKALIAVAIGVWYLK